MGNQVAREKPGLTDPEGGRRSGLPYPPPHGRILSRAPEAPRVRPEREEPSFIEGLYRNRKVAMSMKAVNFPLCRSHQRF